MDSCISDRVNKQLEIFLLNKNEIEKALKACEEEYNILIFFASESGSRGLGIETDDSDFDVTGFFIPKDPMEYLKIIRTFNETIRKIQQKIRINERIYEIDIELWDIKEWLKKKVLKNYIGCDFWFESPLVYRNVYPAIIAKLKSFIRPPFLLYWGKAKSGIGYNQKDIKNKGLCLTKSLMNVLTSLFQYFHFQNFGTFPYSNILDEIDFLISSKSQVISQNFYNEEEYKIIEKNAELYFQFFEDKKKSRKITRDSIPDCIYDLMKLIELKYNTHKKKFELEMIINEDIAQEIFDEILALSSIS